jgi:hypothetical protein
MILRNVAKMNFINDAAHSRSLIESIMMPEVIAAARLGEGRRRRNADWCVAIS